MCRHIVKGVRVVHMKVSAAHDFDTTKSMPTEQKVADTMEQLNLNDTQMVETTGPLTQVQDAQLEIAGALSRVYGEEILAQDILRAIADQPIQEGTPGKWHCDGLRKTMAGKLTQSKGDTEKAKAISRRMSRFMVENKREFESLTETEQGIIKYFHLSTGGDEWADEESLGDRIRLHGPKLSEMGADFSSTPADQLGLKLTSKDMVSFSWKHCGHSETRRATQINSSLNKDSFARCASCRRLENSFASWHASHRPFLDASGLDISSLTEEQMLESAYSKTSIEVAYGCGHRETTSFQSLKAKHKRALEMGQEFIACNGCKVTDGTFEVGFRMALQLATRFVPGCKLDWQQELKGLPGMNYDLTLTAPNGRVYFIEIDGGYHYKGHSSATEDTFIRKVEVDRLKTETVLSRGDSIIRVDERSHRGVFTEEMLDVLVAAANGTLDRYTVIGEECPGAAQVSAELKGLA